MDGCLHIDLIQHEIFSHLPMKDLLNCSIVNFQWNHTARTVLRERQCIAAIRGEFPCEEIRNLCSTLETSFNPPFKALHFSSKYSLCLRSSHAQLTSNAFRKAKLQHLILDFGNNSSCTAIAFIDSVIALNQNNLLSLELRGSNYHHNPFTTSKNQTTFNNLRILTVHCGICTKLLKRLLLTLPNLQEIHGTIFSAEVQVLVDDGKAKLVKELSLKYFDNFGRPANISTYMSLAVTKPKLQKLAAQVWDFRRTGIEKTYWVVFESIIASGHDSLRRLQLDLSTLQLLASSKRLRPLEALDTLTLELVNEHTDISTSTAIWGLSIGCMFPKLKVLQFTLVSDKYAFPENVVLPKEPNSSCITSPWNSVKEIMICNCSFKVVPKSFLEFLLKTFPNAVHRQGTKKLAVYIERNKLKNDNTF